MTDISNPLDCTVLDLSVKSGSLIHVKPESPKSFDSNFTSDQLPVRKAATPEKRQYESSALMNTPPHESEVTTPKTSQNINMYSLPNQFSPMEMPLVNYPRLHPEVSNSLNFPLESKITPSPAFAPQFSPGTPSSPQNSNILSWVPVPGSSTTLPENPLSPMTQTTSKNQQKKPTRPFKVYPNVPLFGHANIDQIMDEFSEEHYEEYRSRVLINVEKSSNKGTNVKMRRENNKNSSVPTSTMHDKDEAYLEKRKKNNAAAKRSRDARKRKEDEIAIRAAYLENKIMWLINWVKKLKMENDELRHFRDMIHRMHGDM